MFYLGGRDRATASSNNLLIISNWKLMLLFLCAWICQQTVTSSSSVDLVDEWAVHVEGGDELARKVALDHGFEFGGKVRVRLFNF